MHENEISGIFPLQSIVEHSDDLDAIRKRELRSGDRVLVRTRNSVYTIFVLDNDQYLVSGGWFDRHGVSPQQIGIAGCTFGGSAIKHDIIAARGLFLEFANQVMTTRIQNYRVIRREQERVV